jgi:hypothetical protein
VNLVNLFTARAADGGQIGIQVGATCRVDLQALQVHQSPLIAALSVPAGSILKPAFH